MAHGYGSKTPGDEAYDDMIKEERPDKDYIDNAAYDKYIIIEVIMDVPVKGPRQVSVRRRIEVLDGVKVGTYKQNLLMDTHEYDL